MKLIITKGATSVSVNVFIRDNSVTTGAGLAGLAYNTASLTAYYVRQNGSATAITLATQTATGAYSSGGFVAVDGTNMPGVYRLDIPDAVLASGVNSAYIMLKGATNMEPCVMEIELTGVDLQDTVRAGMTALPNAAAAASGGLFTRGTGAGQINQAANGQIDVNAVAVGGQTASASGTVTFPNATLASTTNITAGTITTVTNLTNAPTSGDLTATMKTSIATAVYDYVAENSVTFGNLIKRWNAALLGKASGLGTTTAVYRDLADGVNRISATVDADGNRSAVTFNDS